MKTYPGVVALRGVTFEVTAGEVHALVGENGAGKSTLMAVAAGSTLPDRGIGRDRRASARRSLARRRPAARAGGRVPAPVDPRRPDGDREHGLRDAARAPALDVGARAWTGRALAAVGAEVDPSARVNSLSTADRQLLEIAKALALESNVLVLDEPTESLTGGESERLFEQIRRITRQGTAVVYISHRLPEVKGIADRITVLRDGETRGTFAAAARVRGRDPGPDHRPGSRPGVPRQAARRPGRRARCCACAA